MHPEATPPALGRPQRSPGRREVDIDLTSFGFCGGHLSIPSGPLLVALDGADTLSAQGLALHDLPNAIQAGLAGITLGTIGISEAAEANDEADALRRELNTLSATVDAISATLN